MFFGILFSQLLACGVATSLQSASSENSSVKTNGTKVPARSGRTYDVSQKYVSFPLGYYKPESDESASAEKEDDSTPKYDLPTSFDDFVPSDRSPPKKYPAYYKSKGAPPKWKGDSGNGDSSPTWMFPNSPAEMSMMMSMMKDMNGDSGLVIPDAPTGLLSKLTSDPVAFIGAIMLPMAILLGAIIPTIVSLFTNSDSSSIPTVTTVASGDDGSRRRRSEDPTFVKPILEIIENFSSRSISEPTCLKKSFCEATRGANNTDYRPIQKSIYKAFTFVDEYWLEALGVKELMVAMGTGNCDGIHCDASSKVKQNGSKKLI